MSELEIQLCLAVHARAVASMHHLIAQANRDSHRGEWLCNWSIGIDSEHELALEMEDKIRAAIDAAKEVPGE